MKKIFIYLSVFLGLALALVGVFFTVKSLNYDLGNEATAERIKDIEFTGFVKQQEELIEGPIEEEKKTYMNLSVEEAPWLAEEIGTPLKYTREEALEVITQRALLDERYEFILSAEEKLTTGLLVDVVNNPEMTDFMAGFASLEENRPAGELTDEEKTSDLPLYIQWDERWGYEPYGTSCIAEAGCGPTTLAMVVSGLSDEDVTPADMAQYAMEKGYYVKGSGTSWGLMGRGAKNFGLISRNVSFNYLTEENVKSWLDEGAVLILSVKPGDFTIGGHFIVVRGYDDQGFYVNDPFCKYKSSISWEWRTLRGQTKGAFLVNKAETVVSNEPVFEEEGSDEVIEPDEVPAATTGASTTPAPSATPATSATPAASPSPKPSPKPTPTPEPESDDYDDPGNYIDANSVEADYPD